LKPIPMGVITLDDDGKIHKIGQLNEETESTEFYNGILVPGFVNTHCHIELSHLKGAFETGTGMTGFIKQITELRERAERDNRVLSLEKEMKLLYDSGVSAMADISNCGESFSSKSLSPLYTRTFIEVFGTEPEQSTDIMQRASHLKEVADELGIDAAPTPHSCYTMSTKLLRDSCNAALSEGWLSYHNQESWEEEEMIINGRGPLSKRYLERGLSTPPVKGVPALIYFLEILKSTGNLNNQKILLVHNTFTNQESVIRAAEEIKSLFWAICPLSNLFIHNALPPIELLRRHNAAITIGTDSLSSNTTLSITEEIKAIHKFFPKIPLREILEWSSYNGARFLGIEDRFGSFEPGKSPGVVLIENIDWERERLGERSFSRRLV
jgi:cytosine/adenosine deaminase-related metal-dependent hydrolase